MQFRWHNCHAITISVIRAWCVRVNEDLILPNEDYPGWPDSHPAQEHLAIRSRDLNGGGHGDDPVNEASYCSGTTQRCLAVLVVRLAPGLQGRRLP